MLALIFLGILGALIGSFGNVVIHRLPRGESVVFPGSHCPHCGHTLRAFELVPILSWLVLRGRCRVCRAVISARYPLVEVLVAVGFVLLGLRWPLESYGLTVLPLLLLYAMLVIMSAIDIDHQILPDSLTLPAVLVGLWGSALYTDGALPGLSAALFGGALGAGVIALVNRLGGLVLRRFADTKERLWPIGMDQINLAAVGGALGGAPVGLGVAAASVLANLATRRTVRLPEGLVYALWLLALVTAGLGLTRQVGLALGGTFAAAGGVAVVGALYWWLHDFRRKPTDIPHEADDEPIAMGFGDAKLAAVLGVMLGWQNLLVALFLAFLLGALGGVSLRAVGGSRQVPFGPYLALGGLIALFFGSGLIGWYLGLLGVV